MTWTCSECRQLLETADKKYKYNLCHICYFNPAIAKLYRTGEKTPLSEVDLSLDTPGGDCLEVEQASPRELDDNTFQMKIQQVLAPCLRTDLTDNEKAELLKHGWNDLPPGRKPDINLISKDIFEMKKLLYRLFVQQNIVITPEMRKAFESPPTLALFGPLKETGRRSAANPPQSGMPADHVIRRLVEARDRGRMAKDTFQRKIIPPLQITNEELDRSVETNIPVRLMDQVKEWDKDPEMVALVRTLARMPLSEQLELQRPGDGMIEDGRTINLKSLAMETWRNLNAFSVFAVHCKHMVTELLLNDVKTFDTIHEGKAWLALQTGITRFLNCPRCQLGWPAERIVRDQRFEFKWRNFSFHAKCACEYQGEFIVRDLPNWYLFGFQLFRPEEISHQVDVNAKHDSIIWTLPEALRYRIYEGESGTIINTPMDIIRSAQSGELRFDVGRVHRTDQILRAIQATQVVADANEVVLVEKGWGCSMSPNQLNSLLNMHKDPEFQAVNDEDE